MVYLQNMMKKILGKLTVVVHRVNLRVKFPCSVCTHLKIQNEEIPIGQEVPLRLGEAIVEAGLEHEIQATFNTQQQKFDQKRFSIQLYLKTMSGRVPAGMAHFDLKTIKKAMNSLRLNVQRCPDKQAKVQLSVIFDGWNQIQGSSVSQAKESQYMEKDTIEELNRLRQNGHGKSSSLVERQPEYILQQAVFVPELSLCNRQYNQNVYGIDKSAYKLTVNESVVLQQLSRTKTMDKEREFKNLQRKFEQQSVQLKGISVKKQILEKSLKDNELQIKSLKEKYEDLKITNDSLTRKLQYTQSSLKEQLRSISNKLNSAESEKQRLIYEKNEMINRFEERERTTRELLREKEKSHSEEKIGNSRKLQTLNNQLEQSKANAYQLELKANQLEKQLAAQQLNQKKRQTQRAKLQQQIGQLKQQLSRQKNERKRLEEELDSNMRVEEEKKKFKKKLNELEQELAKQLKNFTAAEANFQKQLAKNEDLEAKLKELQSSNKAEKKQSEKLRKQIDSLTRELKDSQKTTQQQILQQTQQNQQLSLRLKELESNLQKSEETRKKLGKQIDQKNSIICTLKESIGSNHDELSQLQKSHTQLQESLEKMEEDYHKLRILQEETLTAKEGIESEKIQLEIQLESFMNELQAKEQEFRTAGDKNKSEKAEFEKKIRQFQQKLSQSNGELSSQIQTLTFKIEELTKQNAVKSEEMQGLQKYVEELQKDRSEGRIERAGLQQVITANKKEIQSLNESILKSNTHNQEIETKNKQLTSSLEELKAHVQSLQAQLNEAHQHGSGNQQKLLQYKTKNIQDLSNFLRHIHGGLILVQPTHQQPQVVSLMQQAISTFNQFVQQKQQSIKNLQNQVDQLQKLNNQFTTEIQDKTNEINCLSDALNSQQERKNELEKESASTITELKEENKVLKNNNQTLHEQLEQTEEIYRQTSSELQSVTKKLDEEIKVNAGLVSKMSIMEQNFNHEMENLLKSSSSQGDRLSEEIQLLQEQIRSKEKLLEDKNSKCSGLEQQITDLSKELQEVSIKRDSQIVEFTTHIAQLKEKIQMLEQNEEVMKQQHIKNRKQSEDQIERLNKLVNDLTNMKAQLEEKLFKLSKTNELKEKAYQAEAEYLEPIRQNLTFLRGYMNQYSRVGDQFESNKNKLLKMATVKLQQYNDRNVAQKVREVSLAFQKLKASVLGNEQMSEQQKMILSEQMKKVQLTLDRALRGDR